MVGGIRSGTRPDRGGAPKSVRAAFCSPFGYSTNGKTCPYNAATVEIILPSWLDWLGSPAVCTIITAVAVILTVLSWVLKNQNRELKLQIQTGQGGPQQQGQQGNQQQQQSIQHQQVTGDVVTINNYGPVTYNTETTGEEN
jgi:hypothetical protein